MTTTDAPTVWQTVRDRSEQTLQAARHWAGLAAGQALRGADRVREVADELGAPTHAPVDQYLLIDGLRFHFRDWGNLPGSASQPPVLLLHGFTGHARGWDDLARRLRRRFRVLALDQRGHGETDWADDYQADRFVADIDAFLTALGLDSVMLVGMSMGGRNAYHFAGQHPERVECLVLGDIGPEIPQEGRTRIATAVQQSDVFDDPEDAVQRALAADPLAQPAPTRARVLNNLLRLPDGRWTFRYDKTLRASESPLPRPNPDDAWALLPRIACPTLLVRGAESDVLALSTATRMLEVMPDCRLVEIPGSGHSLQNHQPAAFYDAIDEFLGMQAARPLPGQAGA